MGVQAAVTAVLSFLSTAILLFPIRRALERWKAIDVPNERSSHSRATPRGGGLAIAAVALATVLLHALIRESGFDLKLAVFGGGALLVMGISLIDDLKSLGRAVRVAVHAVAAGAAVIFIGPFPAIGFGPLGILDLGWVGYGITFVWIVGLTNAFNFMDGIDGIAGSQAAVTGLAWALLGWTAELPAVTLIGLSLSFGSLGFLFHNWSPARVFMGDTGSAFLGYAFAALPLLFMASASTSLEAVAPMPFVAAAFVWPFLFDSGFTFLRRLSRGEKVFDAHRSHLYQRMVIAGSSHTRVTLLYAGFAVLSAGSAAACALAEIPLGIPVAMILIAGAQWAATLLRERNPRSD